MGVKGRIVGHEWKCPLCGVTILELGNKPPEECYEYQGGCGREDTGFIIRNILVSVPLHTDIKL